MKNKLASGIKISRSIAADRPAPSHQEISTLAEVIWKERGCPRGRDDEIWLEAENRLRAPGRSAGRTDRDRIGKISDAESYPGAGLRDTDLVSELDDRFPDTPGRATTSL